MVGAAVWLATIGASASVNYLAGYEFGRNPIEGHVLALIGLAADAWKAAGPIFTAALWRAKRKTPAFLAALVWCACFLFAVSAALGLAARTRSTAASNQEDLRVQYQTLSKSVEALESRLALLGGTRPVGERAAALEAALAKPVMGGTVATVSEKCTKDAQRTRAACEDIAKLRQELSAAEEATKLDNRIAVLNQALGDLRKLGATREADAQAKLISALSFGRVPAANVGLILSLLLVTMVELISAFAPIVVQEFTHVPFEKVSEAALGSAANRGGRGRESQARGKARPYQEQTEQLYSYLSERILPDEGGLVAEDSLANDYLMWCKARGIPGMPRANFLRKFNEFAANDLAEHVHKIGNNFRGFRLAE